MRIFALVALSVLILAGCGSTPAPAAVATQPPTATPTVAPTATITPTPLPNLTALKAQCGMTDDPHVYLGEHILLSVNTLADYEMTYLQVPDATPLAPYAIQGNRSDQPPYSPSFVHQPALLLPFYNGQPHMNLSFVGCSIDGQTEAIQSMRVTLTGFQPYSGNVGIWAMDCTGQNYYTRQNGVGGGGCGGDYVHWQYTATFTATQVGATANLPTFPHPVPSGPDFNFVEIDGFSAAGTYTFALSYTTAHGTVHNIPAPLTILTIPTTQSWTGDACQSAAMQAQIPASSTSRYICPAS